MILARRRVADRERPLLALAGLFVSLNYTALVIADGLRWTALWPVGVWWLCSAALHLVLSGTLPERDPMIVPLVMALSGWGLTLVARLAPAFGARQTVWLAVSSAALLAVTLLPAGLRPLRRFRYTWLLLGLLLLSATLVFGVNPSGDVTAPRLWLGFRVLFFQPSEILKLLLIVFLASYLAEKREIMADAGIHVGRWHLPSMPYLAPMLLMWGFCMVLLIWQRDLGAASLFFIIFLAMLYTSTGQDLYVVAGIVLLAGAAALGAVLFDVVQLRVAAWWNPWPEASGRAFQIVQSLIAVAAGGVIGQGVGQGAPTFVPVVHSDFVFAAIAEEWGLIGSVGVVALIAALCLRAIGIAAQNTRRPFHALLAAGIGVSLGTQSLLIMAGVLKLVPLTGVTLPFVSYGGSSLLSSFIMVGLLLRISDEQGGQPTRRVRRAEVDAMPAVGR